MFRTDSNQDRVNYSSVLLPPEGYALEKAVGTTYSLDLEALTAVLIALGLKEEPDSDLLHSPISMLNALIKVSGKLLIFCESSQIKKPSNSSKLMPLLDKMVIPVSLPGKVGKSGFPAFHPKTWLLQYRNADGGRKYRFIVLSRNLTFDRSWDVSVCIDSTEEIDQFEKTKPIISFLSFLRKQISETISDSMLKRRMIRVLEEELEHVSFSLNASEYGFGEDFKIMPLGIGQEGSDMTKDPLLYQVPGEADYTFHELVAFSPFLSSSIIAYWNRPEHSLTGTTRTLITRKSELDSLKPDQVSRFRIFALKDEIIDGEEIISDESFEKQKQDIHAKIYIRRKNMDTSIYLGSMNATVAAINDNVEMMICLKTRSKYYDGNRFLKELFCGDEDSRTNPFEEVKMVSGEKDKTEDETKILDQTLKQICRIQKKAEITYTGGSYNVHIYFEDVPETEGIEISFAPLNRQDFASFAREMVFSDLDKLGLSEFYQVKVANEAAELTRIVLIPTCGFPDDREGAVVNSIIKDKTTFVEYIAMLLGDDYLLTLLEESIIKKSGFHEDQAERLPALYEKMLRAALEDPERIKEIDHILKMIQDKDIVPDEFRGLYDVFKATLGMN